MSANQKQVASQKLETALVPDFVSVLIVDDQRFDRQRVVRMLNTLDMTLHIAEADSLEAMGTRLTQDKFDLVILDYNLADGTGLQGVDALRNDRTNRLAATIMVTGENQFEVAIEALRRGCSDYISKDELSAEALQRAIINALQKSALREGMENQERIRQKIEGVLDKFARETVLEIKPMLSRMLRQVRGMGGMAAQLGDQFNTDHKALEQSCARLWEFLEDLENYRSRDHADLFSDVAPPAGAAPAEPDRTAKPAAPARPRRPTSETAAPKPRPERPRPTPGRRPRLFGAQ